MSRTIAVQNVSEKATTATTDKDAQAPAGPAIPGGLAGPSGRRVPGPGDRRLPESPGPVLALHLLLARNSPGVVRAVHQMLTIVSYLIVGTGRT
jgi:hypothetical protein